ncbi:hypothetical protein SD71_06205 [Cohnella kolymensis]|uniref:ABC transporter permease n=1 Tax=Cohnella kolymensis TaxID=1590652 RepID=A0ABR5A7R5_9BACL|nr:ABC-2 transporter permease [Cohnella kolymensis]KIL36610.1 hypothetical protein SD71_06205 [Cohnella kolymensis]
MWVKTLILREMRQARALLWIVPVAHFITLGFFRLQRWFLDSPESIDAYTQWAKSVETAYNYGNFEAGARMVLAISFFILALIQMGGERRNGTQEMLFSMPYARRQIFLSKWLFGAGLLTGSIVLNTIIDMIVMASSPVSAHFSVGYHLQEALYSWVTVAAVYTLALFLGAVSGSIASQTVFSGLVLILPAGLMVLIEQFLRIHNMNNWMALEAVHRWDTRLNLPTYIYASYSSISIGRAVMMCLLLAAAFVGALIAYEHNRTENNGKVANVPLFERILQIGFVVCFALLCGAFLTSMFPVVNDALKYYLGLLAGIYFGLSLIRKLTRLRLKI